MNKEELLMQVREIYPDLMYVAIGPARNAEQQCPRQIREWPGRKLCILIDPVLESPPLVHSTDDIVILPLYNEFYWAVQDHINIIHALCRFIMDRTNAYMIVQDYTGRDIYPYYPGAEFLPRVLFDMTYGDGSCCVDFTAVQIIRDDYGNFIQPHFATFVQLCQHPIPVSIRKSEIMPRRRALINYIHYYYRMLSHEHHTEDCMTTVESNIRQYVNQFAMIYEQPNTLDLENLRTLMESAIMDLSDASNVSIPLEDINDIINNPDYNLFGNAIGMLCGLLN